MTRHRIQVECYAASRADERPRRVIVDGRKHTVVRLLSDSIEESVDGGRREHRFKVLTDEGWTLEIVLAADGCWRLESIQGGNER
ncbi:MAG TPA: hypothetical protein VNN73_06925 [Blastocatellia bacterium]|nr:hypothetical protein [Blastocatellia bacterium]